MFIKACYMVYRMYQRGTLDAYVTDTVIVYEIILSICKLICYMQSN